MWEDMDDRDIRAWAWRLILIFCIGFWAGIIAWLLY